MIIPDLNLLIYAYNSDSQFHERARTWWIECLSGQETVGIAWLVALGFLRLWSNPRVFQTPMPIDLATRHVESWIARPMVKMLNPGPRHPDLLFAFLRAEGKGGNVTTDAHLAALAAESGATVHTTDTDFLRFQGVKWLNPLL